MPDMTDEEALSHAESMVNFFRAFKRVEDVIRYARNTKQTLKNDLHALNNEIEATRKEAAVLPQQLAKSRADLETFLREAKTSRVAMEKELQGLRALLEPLRGEIRQLTTKRDEAAKQTALAEQALQEVKGRLSHLSAQEIKLNELVSQHESRLAKVRQEAANLAGV